MLRLSDSRNFSRTLAGLGLILGPVLFVISALVSPAWEDDTAGYLEQVAGNQGAHLASALIFLLGALLLLPGFVGVIHLLRGRRVGVGQVGAGLMMMGVTVGAAAFFVLSAIDLEMVDPSADRAQMVALADRGENSTGAAIFFVLFLGGILLGGLLLAVGLFLKRVVPVWAPVLLVISTVVSFFGDNQVVSLLSSVILAVALAAIGVRVLSISDDDWERWEMLPEGRRGTPGRRSAAGQAG